VDGPGDASVLALTDRIAGIARDGRSKGTHSITVQRTDHGVAPNCRPAYPPRRPTLRIAATIRPTSGSSREGPQMAAPSGDPPASSRSPGSPPGSPTTFLASHPRFWGSPSALLHPLRRQVLRRVASAPPAPQLTLIPFAPVFWSKGHSVRPRRHSTRSPRMGRRRETLVVETIRFASASALGKRNYPTFLPRISRQSPGSLGLP
jgi:hypothetical protein